MNRSLSTIFLTVLMLAMLSSPAAQAIHWYRGPTSGCTPATGSLSDQATNPGPSGGTVQLWHNSYSDSGNATPVTRIGIGQSVTWTWNSAHCHSVTFAGFGSGLHYPTTAPTSPQAVPGVFEYPLLESSPTLSYTHTFNQAGTFAYTCDHHALIGMAGVVIVEG